MLTIQPASTEHLSILAQLCSQTFHDAYAHANTPEDMQQYMSEHFSEEEIAKELSDKNTFIFMVFLGQKAIGYVKLGTSTGPQQLEGKSAMEIERIYVLENYQSKKTGTLLLQKAIEFSKGKNIKVLWLAVWKKNIRAIKFYEREGFQKFGETIFTLGRDLQEDFMMKMEF
jgi:ribosomal protein S18 acetylase RimI-like enzyme